MAKRKRYKTNVKQHAAVRNKEWRTMNVYQEAMSVDELQDVRRALAKQTNQRLLRLERAESVTGGNYAFGAYDVLEEYLKNTGQLPKGDKPMRIKERKDALDETSELRREIAALQNFLNSKSSTVKGMRQIEKIRLEKFESKGYKFADTKEFYDFLNSSQMEDLKKHNFDSEQIRERYDEAREKVGHDKAMEALAKVYEEFNKQKKPASLKEFKKKMTRLTGG